jgi:hypothetical protein
MRKLTLIVTFAALFAGAVWAQIPGTPAGRQFSAWLNAFNSGERATMQQFIEKNMPWGRLDQDLAIRNQTGGFDLKKVEESSETRVVVLAQERGSGQQLVRITMNVAAAEPYQIAGIRVQPAQPQPELAPRKMTASEEAAARNGAPFRQFSAWLEAFNTGDRTRHPPVPGDPFPVAECGCGDELPGANRRLRAPGTRTGHGHQTYGACTRARFGPICAVYR